MPWWVAAGEEARFAGMSRYERCVLMWREMTLRARVLTRVAPERYFEVRYEDLVGDPVRWGKALVGFLGREFDWRFNRALTRAFAASVGVFRSNQSAENVRKANAIAGPLLRDLRYEV